MRRRAPVCAKMNGMGDGTAAAETAKDSENPAPARAQNPLARNITYAFPAAEIDRLVNERLARIGKTARINGFRPGRVPLSIIRQRWGGGCLNEILAEKAGARFVEESPNMPEKPAARPYLAPSPLPSTEGYRVECRYEVLPEIAAPDFSGHTVARPVLEVGEAEIDEMITRLQKDAGQYRETARAARAEDRVLVDFQAFHGEELAEEGKDRAWTLDSPMLNGEISRRLAGVSAGESRTITFKHPESHPEESLRGTEVRLEVSVKTVSELELPKLDGEFFARFGVSEGGESAFRKKVGGRLKSEVSRRLQESMHARAMNALIAATPEFPLPRALVQMEAEAMYRRISADAGRRGLPAAARAPLYAEAARRVALGLIIGRWRETEKPEITDDEINARLAEIAAGYENPEAFAARARGDENTMHALRLELLERRAAEWVCQSAKAGEEKITLSRLLNGEMQ